MSVCFICADPSIFMNGHFCPDFRILPLAMTMERAQIAAARRDSFLQAEMTRILNKVRTLRIPQQEKRPLECFCANPMF
jgi:hypothetical protein